ncbi:MAG: hydroxyacylglutathione hydrolase [Pseudomonadota bacterium]
MFDITAIPAFKDNYIWALHNARQLVVVDPGDAQPVLDFLRITGLTLTAILCTHRHHDHIGGIANLRAVYNVPVYGQRHPHNPAITHHLSEGDTLTLPEFDLRFDIFAVPGHLDDHLAYVAPGILFCGDVLFGAGCGRNFEGTVRQLQQSLQRLARLPDDTRVYCAHEYTLANLRFALACEPDNAAIAQRILATQALRDAHRPSLPSTIALEKATNPFLRCNQATVIHTLQQRGLEDSSETGVFMALRQWRNGF